MPKKAFKKLKIFVDIDSGKERGLSCHFSQETLQAMLMQSFWVQTSCIMVPLIQMLYSYFAV